MPMNLPPVLPSPLSPEPTVGQAESARSNRLLAQLMVMATLLASTWTILVCTFSGSAGTVANNAAITFGLIYPFHLPLSGIAIWAWAKRNPSPRLAALVIAIPWITFPVPFLLNRFNPTGPIIDSSERLINTVLGLVGGAIILILIQPRKTARLLPAFVLRSSALNLLILVFTIALYMMPIAFLFFNWGELQPAGATQVDGHLLAYGLGALVAYTVGCTIPAMLILGYSSLSFFQNKFPLYRKCRIAQLVTSLPLVLCGGTLLTMMWLQTK